MYVCSDGYSASWEDSCVQLAASEGGRVDGCVAVPNLSWEHERGGEGREREKGKLVSQCTFYHPARRNPLLLLASSLWMNTSSAFKRADHSSLPGCSHMSRWSASVRHSFFFTAKYETRRKKKTIIKCCLEADVNLGTGWSQTERSNANQHRRLLLIVVLVRIPVFVMIFSFAF